MEGEIEFTRKKITASIVIPNDPEFGTVDDQFVRNELTALLEGYIYEHTISEKTIEIVYPKPTFLDWLLGRKRVVDFKISVKDVFSTKGNYKTYYIEE